MILISEHKYIIGALSIRAQRWLTMMQKNTKYGKKSVFLCIDQLITVDKWKLFTSSCVFLLVFSKCHACARALDSIEFLCPMLWCYCLQFCLVSILYVHFFHRQYSNCNLELGYIWLFICIFCILFVFAELYDTFKNEQNCVIEIHHCEYRTC